MKQEKEWWIEYLSTHSGWLESEIFDLVWLQGLLLEARRREREEIIGLLNAWIETGTEPVEDMISRIAKL